MTLTLSAFAEVQRDLVRVHVTLKNTGQRSAYARNVYTSDRSGVPLSYEINPHLPPYLLASEKEATRAAAAVWLQEPGTVAVFQGYTHHFLTGPSPYQWSGPLYTRILPGAEYSYSILLSNPLQEWEKNWAPEALLPAIPVQQLWLRIETSPGNEAVEVDGAAAVWKAESSAEYVETRIKLEAPIGFQGFDPAHAEKPSAGPPAFLTMDGPGEIKRRPGRPPHYFDAKPSGQAK